MKTKRNLRKEKRNKENKLRRRSNKKWKLEKSKQKRHMKKVRWSIFSNTHRSSMKKKNVLLLVCLKNTQISTECNPFYSLTFQMMKMLNVLPRMIQISLELHRSRPLKFKLNYSLMMISVILRELLSKCQPSHYHLIE